MGNTNGREEGDNEEDPNRGSIDTDDYEVDGLPLPSDSMLGASNSPPSSPRPSRSPLMFAPQLLVAPLQRGGDAPPTFNHIWMNDPHNSLDAPQEQGIPTLITWTFGGNTVAVQGSWDNWTSRFLVDGERRYIPDLPCIADDTSLVDNLLDVHALLNLSLLPHQSYGHTFPGDEDFAKEPVAVPPQLHLTLLGTQNDPEPSTKPQHVVLNHLYIDKGWPSQSLVALGFTHRFQSKYVTCLEERLRGLINNLVRVSKQRVDTERSRHRTIITSDVRRQILVMNRKAKEDWEKKQSEETEKIRKVNEFLYVFNSATRALESMLKECSPKKYADLQKAIHTYLDSTKETTSTDTNQAASSPGNASSSDEPPIPNTDGSHSIPDTTQGTDAAKPVESARAITTALASAGHTLQGDQVELVLHPLRLAFETKNLKLLEPALDCLHKLIAYDHLEGDPGLDGAKNASLFTDILNMVCGCVDNSSSDGTILQVLKVLLTAIASHKFRASHNFGFSMAFKAFSVE
ncbi:hypothetical protein IFM89_019036 [Coptis chinensis]|uniref:Association with the SNF1 complex (ASC) domain-containing protein n=1 Tax=Coptis chinensis TaxID=261450 RepID=A0A835HDV6_9MAGN|nr:hypothetical protein IFM89_019036 [Coptis chinensis]